MHFAVSGSVAELPTRARRMARSLTPERRTGIGRESGRQGDKKDRELHRRRLVIKVDIWW